MIHLSAEEEKQLSEKRVSKFNEIYHPVLHQNQFEDKTSNEVYSQSIKGTFTSENHLYIIVGTDSGLFVEYIKTLDIKPSSIFLFIDFDLIINELSQKQPENILLIPPTLITKIFDEQYIKDYIYTNQIALIQSLAVISSNFTPLKKLFLKVQSELESIVYTERQQIISYLYHRKHIENIFDNQYSILPLQNQYKNKTIIILAGGPSLDNYLDWVIQNRQQFILISVSRIARRLKEKKIVPDFFMTVDPSIESFEISQEIFNFDKQSTLVNIFHASPYIISQWAGQKVYIGHPLPWTSTLKGISFDDVFCGRDRR